LLSNRINIVKKIKPKGKESMKKSMLMIWPLFIIVLLPLIIGGCGSNKEGSVLAVVNGDKIYEQDLDNYITRTRQTFKSFDQELAARKAILDTLIIQQLLIQAAYKHHIDESEEINRIVLANKDKFLLDVLYQREVLDKVHVTDADIKHYYAMLKDKVQASHILVAREDSARMLLDSLKNGANFEQLAVKYSIDPTAKTNQGDLGYFVWGQLDNTFSENVFKLNPGEISEPFETRYGWHIVKMVDRQPNELRGSYDEMKDQIRDAVEGYERAKRLEEYKDELRKKYTVRIDTVTCDYLMHKRSQLYPPQLLESLPKNDFDLAQLDRDEKDLILATWEKGQMTVGQYLTRIAQMKVQRQAPDFDNYAGLADFIFQMNFMDILGIEARKIGLEDDPLYKENIRKFKELAMADVMQNDSLKLASEPDEGEMRQYYEDHTDEFMVPERVHLYEILLSDYEKAKTVAIKTKTLGEFKAVAAANTERPRKKESSGDLGYIEARTYPRLFNATKNTAVGKIAGPIQIGNQYSVVYVADRKPAETKDFLMVKDEVKDILEKKMRTDSFDNWVKKEKSDSNIKIYENAVRGGIDPEQYTQPDSTLG
jgi:peptidyl-prolyl cis-trans isomerase C